jgi:hypothetical protein
VNFGGRAFSVAASVLWNNLAIELKEANYLDHFKSMLNTYLINS